MHATGTSHRDHVVATIIVVILHLVLAWGLSRVLRGTPAPQGVEAGVTHIQFVPRVRPEPTRLQDVKPVTGERTRATNEAATTGRPQTARPQVEASRPHETRPLSAVLLGQARQWAEEQARSEAASPDVFDRRPPLSDEWQPSRSRTRFRFRPQTSVASVVNSIGKAFSPPGYEADPCLQNRRNITELATQGDTRELRQDIDFERRHCRP